MKTAVLVGAGDRGCIYADYTLKHPEELKIIAVVEPNKFRNGSAANKYNIPEDMCFSDLDGFLSRNIECDFVINATMDTEHFETASKIMNAKYNMLLEKPIVPNKNELLTLQRLAHDNNVKVNVCHVLRYTPYYKRIKAVINSGEIGGIMTMEMNEHVAIAHFLSSFIRGKWKSEEQCGSSFLLQKSCHDMDLVCWLNNATKPVRVMSMGNRSRFVKENAPDGATDFCYNCPHNDTCLYSAEKVYLEKDLFGFLVWADINKPRDEITYEEKAEYLKTSDFGRCAYNSGGDINDRQTVNIEFENGSLVSFTMVGATSRAGRSLHIVGTKGEIIGVLEDNKFVLRKFDRSGDNYDYYDETVDVSEELKKNTGGHFGGDYAIMQEFLRYLDGDTSSISITEIDDSINSHLVVYAAEESNKTAKAVKI